MNVSKKLIAVLLIFCLLPVFSACEKVPEHAQHMILNKNGTYGGSFDEEKYGKGAPLNGEYDVANSDYYTVNNDYYNMPSTEERLIFPQFSSYQQTMQDSSGLACLLMILNYMGKDVRKEYSELELLKKYEEVNNTQVFGNGTSEEGLINLINALDLGYTAVTDDPVFESDITSENMKNFFTDCIREGKFVLVRYQSPVGHGWKVVIGYDDLGNVKNTLTGEEYDHINDDVIIFAEPYDGHDHCQDGYTFERAANFFAWWFNRDIDGQVFHEYSYVVIDPDLDIKFNYQPVDETVKQTLYDIHLPLNPDGTYGGTRDETLYGRINAGRGWWNHTESNYYKINDFYNMGNTESRILLTNYTVLQQTMSSSCGVCAAGSVLKYNGREESYYDLELVYANHLQNSCGMNINEAGGANLASIRYSLLKWGYTTKGGNTTKEFPTYESFMLFLHSNLQDNLPIVSSAYLVNGAGHFITLIGVDNMGTDYIYDDVIIAADSADYWDGYQDGYNIHSAYKYFSQSVFKDNYLLIYNEK